MPVSITKTVAAAMAKIGDSVPDRNGEYRLVNAKKIGTKWVEFRDMDGGLIARVETDTEIKIKSSVPTKEEEDQKEAEAHADMVKRWKESLDRRVEEWITEATGVDLDAAMAKGATKIKENYDAYPYIDEIMTEAANLKIAKHIAWIWGKVVEQGCPKEDQGITTVALWHRHEMASLLETWNSRTLSRSTSVISNLMSDLHRERVVVNMDQLCRWYVSEDQLAEVFAELVEAHKVRGAALKTEA